MMKKALLGLVCLATLVMVPACGKKERRVVVETRTETTEPVRPVTTQRLVKRTIVKKQYPKTRVKTNVKKERVGKILRAEEMNEEDKD